MSWDPSDAVKRLRALLGDLPTDKFVYKALAYPAPDGVITSFSAGDTHLVANTLHAYVNGVESDPLAEPPSLNDGTFKLTLAPAVESEVQASYHYQWFTEDQLTSFLENAANTMGLEFVFDDTLPIGLRPAILHFAAYFAYMNKASETADSLVASAEGYQIDQSKSHPNWRALAQAAWDAATASTVFYNENILQVGGIGIKIRSYCIPEYMPGG